MATTPDYALHTGETSQQYWQRLFPNSSQASSPTGTTTSAADMTPGIGSLKVPNLTPAVGNIANAKASAAGASTNIDTVMKQQADQAATDQAQADQARATQNQNVGFIQKFLSDQPSTADTRSNAFSQTGINPREYFADQKTKIAEIGSLTEDYNKTIAERDAKIQQIQAAGGGLTSGQDIEVTRINNQYATQLNQKSANINAKSAVLQALQGNFHEAESFVNQAVNDVTADQKFKLDSMLTLYNLNEDSIKSLDDKYKTAFSTAITLAKDKYDNSRQDARTNATLIVEAAKAGVDLSSYINQPLSETQKAYATQVSAAYGTFGGYKFTSSQLNKGASNAGLGIEDFKTVAPEVKNFYINQTAVGQKRINDLVASVQSGETSVQDATDQINSDDLPQSVKDYLIKKVTGKSSDNSSGGSAIGNFFGNVWDEIKYLTGNGQ